MLDNISFLENVRLNIAVDQTINFLKLKIKIRSKIVADGLEIVSLMSPNVGFTLMRNPLMTLFQGQIHCW